MKVFVWDRLDKVSDNYHTEGGLVVFAPTLERAIELAKNKGAVVQSDESPDIECECTKDTESVHIHPDAGCC